MPKYVAVQYVPCYLVLEAPSIDAASEKARQTPLTEWKAIDHWQADEYPEVYDYEEIFGEENANTQAG